MTPLLVAILGSGFGDEPNQQHVELGRKIARQYDRDHWQRQLEMPPETGALTPVTELYREDRRVIGTWSEGVRKLDVEWVIRLSPELMSRWVGYLDERELWPAGELENRWSGLRQEIGQRPVFLVVLSAFPKKEMLGFGDTISPNTDELDNNRLVFEQEGQRIDSISFEVFRQRAETRSELDKVPWWQYTRLSNLLTSRFERSHDVPLVQRGDYYRTWTWVMPAREVADKALTIKIASRRKIRETTFSFPAICDISKG